MHGVISRHVGSVIAALRFLHNAKTSESGDENLSVAILEKAKHTNLHSVSLFFFASVFPCKGHSGRSITTSNKNLRYLAPASRPTAWKEERGAREPLPAAM